MESVSRVCSLPGCTRPCFREGSIVHPYCSRTHANEALEMGMQASLGASGASFKMCRLNGCSKEVHVDRETGHVYDFCSRRHAKLAKSCRDGRLDNKGTSVCRLMECEQTVYRDPVTGKESEYCSNKHFMIGEANRSKECIRKGCSRPAWIEEDTGHLLAYCGSKCAGEEGLSDLVGKNQCSLPGCVRTNMVNPHTKEDMGYCSEDHRLRATQRSLGPVSEPFVDRTFRGGTTSATDFELSVLTKLHPNYASIKEQFLNKWVKSEPTGGVSVVRIFKIKSPEDVRVRHEGYRGIVSNVVRRFHGTSCSSICTFFVDLRGGPCGETNCNVCNICTHGFRLGNNVGRTARKTNFNLRYGHGLYFSSISGKANDYAVESEKTNKSGKQIRCMFMASVAVGKAFKTTEGILDSSQCPPPGYDSVIGEVGPALNYDELVVYKPEAALPTYLISYILNH